MNADDQPVKSHRASGDAAGLRRSGGAQAAKEATILRLQSLGLGTDASESDAPGHARPAGGPRSVDDEPAALVYDSNFDAELFAAVRAGSQALRQLTFEASDVLLEIEVSGAGHLVGQVVPPQAAVVELRHRAGTTPVETDELGYFHVPDMPEGPVSFRCCPAGPAARSVATAWITL
jgi:hypothetical protein